MGDEDRLTQIALIVSLRIQPCISTMSYAHFCQILIIESLLRARDLIIRVWWKASTTSNWFSTLVFVHSVFFDILRIASYIQCWKTSAKKKKEIDSYKQMSRSSAKKVRNCSDISDEEKINKLQLHNSANWLIRLVTSYFPEKLNWKMLICNKKS